MLTGCSWGARGVRRGRRGRRGRGVPLEAPGPPGPACLRTQGTWCPGVPYEARGVVPGLTRGDCRTKLETTRDSTIPHSKHKIFRVEDDMPSNAGYFTDGVEKSHDFFVFVWASGVKRYELRRSASTIKTCALGSHDTATLEGG